MINDKCLIFIDLNTWETESSLLLAIKLNLKRIIESVGEMPTFVKLVCASSKLILLVWPTNR